MSKILISGERLCIFATTSIISVVLGILFVTSIAFYRGDIQENHISFISDSFGSPPQSGIATVLFSITSLSILSTILYFADLNEHHKASSGYRFLNTVRFASSLLSALGLLIVAGFPVQTISRNGEWVTTVLYPHMVGGVLLFSNGVVFTVTNTCIEDLPTRNQYRKNKSNKWTSARWTRVVSCVASIIAFSMLFSGVAKHRRVLTATNAVKNNNVPTAKHESCHINQEALFEWILFFSLMAHLIAISNQFKNLKVVISVTRINNNK